jgi:hypothetical protein
LIWLIIIGVLLVAIGPIFYVLPSAKDRRLAKLRNVARQQGMHVRVAFLPKLDPQAAERVSSAGVRRQTNITCAEYQLPVSKRLSAPVFLLRRLPASPTVPVYGVFAQWGTLDASQRDRLKAEPKLVGELASVVDQLPGDTLGLGFDLRVVSCFWSEGATADEAVVVALKGELQGLVDALIRDFSVNQTR